MRTTTTIIMKDTTSVCGPQYLIWLLWPLYCSGFSYSCGTHTAVIARVIVPFIMIMKSLSYGFVVLMMLWCHSYRCCCSPHTFIFINYTAGHSFQETIHKKWNFFYWSKNTTLHANKRRLIHAMVNNEVIVEKRFYRSVTSKSQALGSIFIEERLHET